MEQLQDQPKYKNNLWLPVFIGLGTGLGALLGNIGVGMSIGVAIGTMANLITWLLRTRRG